MKISNHEQEIVNSLEESTIKRIMTPRNDLVFKKLFGSVGKENIVKDFLEAILDIKIKSLELGKETILLPEEIDERAGVLDVKATLENGTIIDIEMQNANTHYIVKRAHFYASRMYGSQLKAARDFKELKKVVVIFITNFNIFNNIKNYHTKWLMTEQNNLKEHFDEIELHYIEMPKFLASKYNKKRKIDQWLLFLDYSRKELLREIMEENENIKAAEEDLKKIQDDKHAQYLAWLREKYILETNTSRVEGYDEGYDEGYEKGSNESRKEEKKEIVIKMLKENFEISMISRITGLSEEEIEKIMGEME